MATSDSDNDGATPNRVPTTEKLALALEAAGASRKMIEAARAGLYDDYKSDIAGNIMQLVIDARHEGLRDIERRAIDGEFDAQRWEAEEWERSPDGIETFNLLLNNAALFRQLYTAGQPRPAPADGMNRGMRRRDGKRKDGLR